MRRLQESLFVAEAFVPLLLGRVEAEHGLPGELVNDVPVGKPFCQKRGVALLRRGILLGRACFFVRCAAAAIRRPARGRRMRGLVHLRAARSAMQNHSFDGARRDFFAIVPVMRALPSGMIDVVLLVRKQRLIFWLGRIKIFTDDDAAIHRHGARAKAFQRTVGEITGKNLTAAGHGLPAQPILGCARSKSGNGRGRRSIPRHEASGCPDDSLNPVQTLTPDALLFLGELRSRWACETDGEGIVAVRPATDEEWSGASGTRLRGRALLPGFVNAHSHAFQRGLRGHVQHASGADSFWSWRETMYQLATSLDPERIFALSRVAFLEMLRAGFTTVGEFHYVHHQPDGSPYADPDAMAMAVAAAAGDVGIRIVLLRVAYGRAGFQVEANPRQRRFLDRDPDDVLAAIARLRAKGVRVGLAPHSIRACPMEWLEHFAPYDGIVHAHVDEQPAEIAASLAEHACRPVHAFDRAGLLSPRFTAVHLTHPDDAEIDTLTNSGARVCACPTTELDLGDGFLPVERISSPICLGTDSHALIDPFTEMRSIEWHARGVTGRRNVIPHEGPDGLAVALLEMGSIEGARALDVNAGEIGVGKLADLVAVDITRIEFAESRLLPAIVFNGSPGAVTDVWVGGRKVV